MVGKIIRHLAERMIDGGRRSRYDVLIIDIGGDPDNAARALAHADEIHHRVGPHNVVIERILPREHPLRDTLADDHYRLATAPVLIVEVAAFNDGHAERREKYRGNRAELWQRILFVTAFPLAFAGEFKSWTEAARISPRHAGAFRDSVDSRHLFDSAYHVPIEVDDLIRSLAIRHHGHIHSQHAVHVETRLRGLQREQRLDQHARSGQQDERGRNLCDREDAQPAARPSSDAHASAAEVDTLRRV